MLSLLLLRGQLCPQRLSLLCRLVLWCGLPLCRLWCTLSLRRCLRWGLSLLGCLCCGLSLWWGLTLLWWGLTLLWWALSVLRCDLALLHRLGCALPFWRLWRLLPSRLVRCRLFSSATFCLCVSVVRCHSAVSAPVLSAERTVQSTVK